MDRRQLLLGLTTACGLASRLPLRFGVGLVGLPLARDEFAQSRSGIEWALVRTGYLDKGENPKERSDEEVVRALQRFQRQATHVYRIDAVSGLSCDVTPHEVFNGRRDGVADSPTVRELTRWVNEGWTRPVGRFRFASVSDGIPTPARWLRWAILREDVAGVWREMMREVSGRGGSVIGPYGDTRRKIGPTQRDGASPRSFHIPGRAIDLNQRLAMAPRQRYFVIPEDHRGRRYWRILCRTEKQDGTQGKYYRGGSEECWRYVPRKERERAGSVDAAAERSRFPLPGGWYLDLTELLERQGHFERIAAHTGYETNYKRAEWWHYHWSIAKQATFLDECELVGIREEQLLAAGYRPEDLERRPG